MPVQFFDENGIERDLSWAENLFGTQAVHEPGVWPVFELVALHAAIGLVAGWFAWDAGRTLQARLGRDTALAGAGSEAR